MIKLFIRFFIAINFVFIFCVGIDAEKNPSSILPEGEAVEQEIIHLFNRKNFDGWYTFLEARGRGKDPKEVFTVADGVMRISGEEWGCITTEKEYANYHLIVEYRWGEETFKPRKLNARNGGVLLHSQGADGAYDGKWMNSIECQIIEGGTGDVIVVGDGSDDFSVTSTTRSDAGKASKVFEPASTNRITVNWGRIDWQDRDLEWKDVKGFRGSKDVENSLGEWNTLEVIANGGDIKIFLNNHLVNHVFNTTPQKGRIQIQSEGAEMFYRRVDLIPLPTDFRFLYNSDANNIFPEGVDTPEELYPYIDEVAETAVTSYLISPNWGMAMNFPTKVGDMIGENLSPELEASLPKSILSFREFVSDGHDPLGLLLDRAKAHQLETFVSFRLNEVHGVESEDSWSFDRFYREHPEWRIGKAGDPMSQLYIDIVGPRSHPIVGSWLPGGLNFAIAEVREYRLLQLREICEKYAIDGLEIDFQRFPMYFKPGEEAAGVGIMTKWMREVRAMVDAVGKKRGRPLLLTARVLSLPERNKGIGLDPGTWAYEGILDFITVSHYLHNNFQLPIEEYRKLFPKDFPVYASIEVEPGMKRYRHIAYPLWRQNINGVSLFNFFTSKGSANPPPYDSIREIGYPVITKDSLLLVANKHSNTLSFVDPKTFEVIENIPTGPNPHEIIVTPDQKTAYLNTYKHPGNSISVIDLIARKQIKEISTGYYSHGRLQGAATSPDGRYAYFIMEHLNYILQIDTQTNSISKTMPTQGRNSKEICVSPDGKYILTANTGSKDISVIDRSTGWLQKKIPVEKGVRGMAFTPDRKFLWALNEVEGSITIIDIQTLEPIKTIACAGMPANILFTSDGKRALVTGRSNEGTLIVIDVAASKEIKRIGVGAFANGIALSPDEKYAFVGCEDEGKAQIKPDGESTVIPSGKDSGGIYVIDMKTLEIVSNINTGLGPDAMLMWYPPYQ